MDESEADELSGDTIVVNPEISSGLPLQDKNRYPQPGSRPEIYSTPATMGACLSSSLVEVLILP